VVLLAGFAWVVRAGSQSPPANDHYSTKAPAGGRVGGTHPHRPRVSRHARTGTGGHHHSTGDRGRPIRRRARIARQMLELARNMTRRSLFRSAALRLGLALSSPAKQQSADRPRRSHQVDVRQRAHSPFPSKLPALPRKLPLQVENNLLRIAQEALANAMKHSHATPHRSHPGLRAGQSPVARHDDGIGFEADKSTAVYGGHFGLLDMSERAEKIGGAFSLISAPGQGTEIRVEVAERRRSAACGKRGRRASGRDARRLPEIHHDRQRTQRKFESWWWMTTLWFAWD
jgi:hypothetical protein